MFPSHADLHLHTDRSDGALDPAALAERVRRERPDIELLAVADRDTIAGSARFAQLVGERALVAVELSARLRDHAVSLVALSVADASLLAPHLRRPELEQARWLVARRRHPEWELPAILGEDETAASVALAALLLERGGPAAGDHDRDDPLAVIRFARELERENGPLDVSREEGFLRLLPDLVSAIGIAHRAGALAIVGRPGDTPGWHDPIADLRDLAIDQELDGFEAYRLEHPPAMRTKLVQLAYRMDMIASVGSGARTSDDPIGLADGRPTRTLRAEIDRRIRAWR